jgi:hypothetical protein
MFAGMNVDPDKAMNFTEYIIDNYEDLLKQFEEEEGFREKIFITNMEITPTGTLKLDFD